MNSGVGTYVSHFDGTTVRQILLGLMEGENLVTKDGMPFSHVSTAKEHLIAFLRTFLPSTVNVTAIFPAFSFDTDGNMVGEVQLPHVSLKAIKGGIKEVGIGRRLWETPDGFVYGFNQVLYLEFNIFGRTDMKIDQIVDQIELQIQIAKSTGGALWLKGFQNFMTLSSDPARGFRYDTPWDFRMQHQYAEVFYARLTIRTSFDVTWVVRPQFGGVISQIIFEQTEDIPWETVIGSSLAYLRLEELFFDLHGGVLI